ncbi:MAG TPA: hypothetical protein VIF57_27840 [Polyangia bacterium]|jgi:hypothetical protein
MKGSLFATSVLAATLSIAAAVPARAAEPKFYFHIKEVTAAPDVDASVKARAAEALKAELASRSEWASDLGPAAAGQDPTALAAELARRKLRGFEVTVRIDSFKQEMKEPRPGGRMKQLAVNVKLTIIGATIPDAKFAFEGNGESGVEAEVSESRMAKDSAMASSAALKSAIKQAVEEANTKLGATTKPAGGAKKPAKKKA